MPDIDFYKNLEAELHQDYIALQHKFKLNRLYHTAKPTTIGGHFKKVIREDLSLWYL